MTLPEEGDRFAAAVRLLLEVPANRVMVLAAGGGCDSSFSGDHSETGSYILGVEVDVSGSIAGRLVDVATGRALSRFPGDASISLSQCDSTAENADCSFFANERVGEDGRFAYPERIFDQGLQPGISYRIDAAAFGYVTARRRFVLTPSQALDFGDIGLSPVSVIGSIPARVTEQRTGTPISGNSPLSGRIEMLACNAAGEASEFLESDSLDADGKAVFRGGSDSFHALITPGTYRIEARSSEHPPGRSRPFTLDEGENISMKLRLTSRFPVKVAEIRPTARRRPRANPARTAHG